MVEWTQSDQAFVDFLPPSSLFFPLSISICEPGENPPSRWGEGESYRRKAE